MSSTVTLTFPAKAEYLVLGRLALAGVSRTHEIDPETLADLKLAVTEACANAVRHAYAGQEGQVTLELAVVDGQLEIVVEDQGTGFEPKAVDDWLPDDLDEDGMGLAIIRAVVDDLDVQPGSRGSGTRLSLRKAL